MKAGRPRYHIPAKWITVYQPSGTFLYYELDSKGNIANRGNDIFKARHSLLAPPQIEKNNTNKKEKKKKNENKENKENELPTFNQQNTSKVDNMENNINNIDDHQVFENDLLSDDIYHQEEDSFEIMNFFE
ncbi:hypothetical protein M9Y10_001955 [Tritrichomonas musculus]|uniref:WW domain-containing protein n=1 Tax=Tritrichomonas musculus TaxID=1915356 RepID=A0ABR2L8I0_9EUKA